MPEYRRVWVAGGTYFFTVNLRDRGSDLLVSRIGDLRAAVRFVLERAPFHVDAWVVLPEHMHCVWTLPPGDADYAGRWRALKARFSRAVEAGEWRSASRVVRGERGIWQRRFWEHAIRDERDYGAHIDYVHFNPVRHGYVARPGDWPFSSFRRCVAKGMYPADWAPGEVGLAEAGSGWARRVRKRSATHHWLVKPGGDDRAGARRRTGEVSRIESNAVAGCRTMSVVRGASLTHPTFYIRQAARDAGGSLMLVAAGNINDAYDVLGIVHAVVTRPAKSGGCSGGGGLPVQEAYESVTAALQSAAAKSGANGVIHVGYNHRVSTATIGCNQDKAVFEVYGWGTAIRLRS